MDVQIVDSKEKSLIQERLVKLYLRLNGYFSTGFIIHSSERGDINTEIDLLAVRFPKNSEPEREISQDEILFTSSKYIDFLICEVKSHRKQPRFNESLRNNLDNIEKILRWFGIFSDEEIKNYSSDVHNILQNGNIGTTKPSKVLIEDKKVQIRPLIFKPETHSRRREQPWFINQRNIFNFISDCMRTELERASCATIYDYTAWGTEFNDIVSFFKRHDYDTESGMSDLYKHIDENN